MMHARVWVSLEKRNNLSTHVYLVRHTGGACLCFGIIREKRKSKHTSTASEIYSWFMLVFGEKEQPKPTSKEQSIHTSICIEIYR